MRIGDKVKVKVNQYYTASHGAHGIQQDVVYTVIRAAVVGGSFGIAVDNNCPQGDGCSCKLESKPFWTASCWEKVEIFTEEDVQKAKPMPSLDDVASFFQARIT